MTTWLHRISWFAEVSRPLLEHGYLSIGFSDFGDDDCIDGVCGDSGEQYLCERMKQDWGKVPRSRFSLIAFLAGMKKGDRVLVPGHGEFSVYRICEDRAQPIGKMYPQVLAEIKGSANVGLVVDTSCLWRVGPDGKPDRGEKDEKYLDVGFTRKVEPIKVGIPRDGYCDSDLTSRMKMRQTTADISDLDNAVADAISAFKNNRPFDLHGNIVEQAVPPILDLLQDKLEIVFPAKSNDSAISKIFSSPDYQSILSQPSLDLEQQVVFLLWSVKAKSKKNFLSGMVRSSLKKKINDNSSLPNGSLKYSTTTNNNGSLLSVESQESDLSVSSDCGLKIKKKLLKMSDTVHSFSGEW